MEMEYEQGRFLKYSYGNLCCHLDAVHATRPSFDEAAGVVGGTKRWDIYTAELISGAAACGCTGIIATVSRLSADLNRGPEHQAPFQKEALQEYRQVIRNNLGRLSILSDRGRLVRPYLHLAIHGMGDHWWGKNAIELGNRRGCSDQTCSGNIFHWFLFSLKNKLDDRLPGVRIVSNRHFTGDPSLAYHRYGYCDYRGYGQHYNAIQLEISYTLRRDYRGELVAVLVEIAREFHQLRA